MICNELGILQHKVLPLIFLYWKENVDSFAQDFPQYGVKFAPSLKKEDFSVVKNDKRLQAPIMRYLKGDETVYTFIFPVKETPQYLGLAQYAFLVYHRETFTIRLFLLELDRWFNGEEYVPSWNVVEYKCVDSDAETVQFERKVYR